MNKKVLAIIFAILAAFLYAINIPLSKKILNNVSPTMLASYLYLGAGIGVSILYLITKSKLTNENEEKISKKHFPYILGMIILDIIAPILLMFGLLDSKSSNASLLNNFEIVCTSLIALIFFKEKISNKMWIAIILVTLSSFILSLENIVSFSFSWGAVLVILATALWGLENNCTKKLSSVNNFKIVILKGIFSGLGSLIIALVIGEEFASWNYIIICLILGFFSYGLSIYFYIKSQGIIGAAKTSAYYSVAPFIGSLLSFIIFKEKLLLSYFIGLLIMIIGTLIVIYDTLKND